MTSNPWHYFSIDVALLQSGVNTLAVEIHQATPTSSDIRFDLEVVGAEAVNLAPQVYFSYPSPGTSVLTPGVVTLVPYAWDLDGVVERVEYFADGTKIGESSTSPFSFDWNNPPLGHHELLARATDDQGAQGASQPLLLVVNAVFISRGALWKYREAATSLGTLWRYPAYNDSSWLEGPAQLGYGDGDEGTVLGYGPDPNNKYITTYFHHAFKVDNPERFKEFVVRLFRDDGAVVYLNAVELLRSNMPEGNVSYQTLAATSLGMPEEQTYNETIVEASRFSAGSNLLAVEVH